MGAADRRRRTRLRRQPERDGLLARRRDRLHPLDVQRDGGVRTAIAIGPRAARRTAVFFGDTAANAYALDADTGAPIWTRKVDDHPLARITGSPTLYDGRLYVPVSSYEESQGADPQYACCTFRGSVVALDAAHRTRSSWKTYMIADAPAPRGKSTAGVQLWGPSGSAIWSRADDRCQAPACSMSPPATPTAVRRSPRAMPSSRSISPPAAIRWMRQVTPGDVYVSNCRAGKSELPGDATDRTSTSAARRFSPRGADGRDLIVIGQKSGVGFALDPDKNGDIVWQYRAGEGGVLGGIEWGSAVDATRAYFAVSDITQPAAGRSACGGAGDRRARLDRGTRRADLRRPGAAAMRRNRRRSR